MWTTNNNEKTKQMINIIKFMNYYCKETVSLNYYVIKDYHKEYKIILIEKLNYIF